MAIYRPAGLHAKPGTCPATSSAQRSCLRRGVQPELDAQRCQRDLTSPSSVRSTRSRFLSSAARVAAVHRPSIVRASTRRDASADRHGPGARTWPGNSSLQRRRSAPARAIGVGARDLRLRFGAAGVRAAPGRTMESVRTSANDRVQPSTGISRASESSAVTRHRRTRATALLCTSCRERPRCQLPQNRKSSGPNLQALGSEFHAERIRR